MPHDDCNDSRRASLTRVPLGRMGTADEAAAVALFLVSDESSYVTAGRYAVDAGVGSHSLCHVEQP